MKFTNYDEDVVSDLQARKVFQITKPVNWSIKSFQEIYQDK